MTATIEGAGAGLERSLPDFGPAVAAVITAVPFDPRPPMVTSGIRIGTPAPATRVGALTARFPLYPHLGAAR